MWRYDVRFQRWQWQEVEGCCCIHLPGLIDQAPRQDGGVIPVPPAGDRIDATGDGSHVVAVRGAARWVAEEERVAPSLVHLCLTIDVAVVLL